MNTKFYLSVSDISGKIVIVKESVTLENEILLKLDISKLSNGLYITTIKFDDGHMISTKLLKN